jgi:hypothetical protein
MTKRKTAVYFLDSGSTYDVFMAFLEQTFETKGADAVARFFASSLRGRPSGLVLNTVASWLDPEGDDYFRLVVKRRRDRRTWTARANEVAIANAVAKLRQDFINAGKRDGTGRAVRKVAKQLEISKAKVRQAWQRNR